MYDLPSAIESDVQKNRRPVQTRSGSHKLYYSKDFFYENQEKNAQPQGRTLNLTIPLSIRCMALSKVSHASGSPAQTAAKRRSSAEAAESLDAHYGQK
jgi:hypothetical protein